MEIYGDINKIIDEIKRITEEKIKEIEKETELRMKSLLESHKKHLKELEEKMMLKANTEAEIAYRRIISEKENEWRQKILEAKREILEEVKELTKEYLSRLDSEKKKRYIEAIIKKSSLTDGIIVPSKGWEKEASEIAKKYGFDIKDSIEAPGGVIIESKDGKISINGLVDYILDSFWEDKVEEIAKLLFE